MTDRKLWNRADVRAEMNRMVKEATDACKKLHDVAGRIAALGVETIFIDDAQVAIAALRKRAEIAPVMVIDSVTKLTPASAEAAKRTIDAWKKFNPPGPTIRTADGTPVHSVGEVLRDVRCATCNGAGIIVTPDSPMLCRSCSGKGALTPKSWPQALSDAARETWGDRGCVCALKHIHANTLPCAHYVRCPCYSLTESLKEPMADGVRCKMREPTKDGGFNLTPASRLPGVWRDYGCTCSISVYNVSGRHTWHSPGCPVRVPGEE